MQVLTKRICLIVLAMALSFAVMLCYSSLASSGNTPNAFEGPLGKLKGKPDPDAAIDVPQLSTLDSDMTVLLCGTDNSSNLTDVLMLARLDAKNNALFLLQIPRDMYIGSDYVTGKVNAVYSNANHDQSIKTLKNVLESQLRVSIDHYAMIDLDLLKQAVDKIGGVTMDVPSKIEYLPGKVLLPGEQTLTGEQSIWIVRHRKGYENGDIDRLEMQKLFLGAALSSAKEVGKFRAVTIAAELLPKVKTDLSFTKATGIINLLFDLSSDKITTALVPGYGMYYKSYAVYVVDRAQLAPIINTLFRSDSPIGENQLRTAYPPKGSAR